jgi:hypothetical protein
MLILPCGFVRAASNPFRAFNAGVETRSTSLPDELGRAPGVVTVALFSQVDCEFCLEVREHYLRPLAATRPEGLVIAEIELGNTRALVGWRSLRTTHADFARAHGVRFAPTVMFFNAQGRELAPAIVGLSRDFFGAYLEARIAQARAAARHEAGAVRFLPPSPKAT